MPHARKGSHNDTLAVATIAHKNSFSSCVKSIVIGFHRDVMTRITPPRRSRASSGGHEITIRVRASTAQQDPSEEGRKSFEITSLSPIAMVWRHLTTTIGKCFLSLHCSYSLTAFQRRTADRRIPYKICFRLRANSSLGIGSLDLRCIKASRRPSPHRRLQWVS